MGQNQWAEDLERADQQTVESLGPLEPCQSCDDLSDDLSDDIGVDIPEPLTSGYSHIDGYVALAEAVACGASVPDDYDGPAMVEVPSARLPIAYLDHIRQTMERLIIERRVLLGIVAMDHEDRVVSLPVSLLERCGNTLVDIEMREDWTNVRLYEPLDSAESIESTEPEKIC